MTTQEALASIEALQERDTGIREPMVINLGPQHPSTHGVLRLVTELDGEVIRDLHPVIGYLHTGIEKQCENKMYWQAITLVTRMDYLASFFNIHAYTSAVEKLLDASVTRGEKIALMGRNGLGKTTLLHALLSDSPTVPESELRQSSGYDGAFVSGGRVIWGHEAAVGYFAQDHKALIRKGMTAFEWLHQWDTSASQDEIRGLLGQMLFARDDGNKRTDVLSGGESARLLFCKLMLQKPNVLVLDEPTNHLDLESINALNIALQRYQGTVLLVSHDHDLIDEVATRVWHFEPDQEITDFKGAYEEFQAVCV